MSFCLARRARQVQSAFEQVGFARAAVAARARFRAPIAPASSECAVLREPLSDVRRRQHQALKRNVWRPSFAGHASCFNFSHKLLANKNIFGLLMPEAEQELRAPSPPGKCPHSCSATCRRSSADMASIMLLTEKAPHSFFLERTPTIVCTLPIVKPLLWTQSSKACGA